MTVKKYLIITNGDNAVETIKNCGISADFIPWRDVLHDGPVPNCDSLDELSKIRAEFLTTLSWGDFDSILKMFQERDSKLAHFVNYEEVILWFEHDLYDQLQLLQILDWFSKQDLLNIRITQICGDEFITEISTKKLLYYFENRKIVSDSMLKLSQIGWKAFCSDDIIQLQKFIENGHDELPFLNDAMKRFLQEYPDKTNGLSRSERQILEIIRPGKKKPSEIFIKFQEYEDAKYLGDWTFFHYINNLIIDKRHSLIETSTKEPFKFPPLYENDKQFLSQNLQITETGEKVLSGELNHIDLNGINKWLGGVHLKS
jgi:hypothetical protein